MQIHIANMEEPFSAECNLCWNHTLLLFTYSYLVYSKEVLFSYMEIIPYKNWILVTLTLLPKSSLCGTPSMYDILHNSNYIRISLLGIRDDASATTFSLPSICSISKLNLDKNYSHLACLRDSLEHCSGDRLMLHDRLKLEISYQ